MMARTQLPIALSGAWWRPRRVARRVSKTPPLFVLCFALLILSEYVTVEILGFKFIGWAWVMILVFSLMRIALHLKDVRFPVLLWAPWVGYVVLNGARGYELAWQSTAQIVCPVVAGVAATTYRLEAKHLQRLIRWTFVVFYGAVVIVAAFSYFGLISFGPGRDAIRSLSVFPDGSYSALFFQSMFIANYMLNRSRKENLVYYLLAVSVPVLSATRGPLIATVALLVFAFIPIRLGYRLSLLVLAAVVALAAFYTPGVQRKMFFSGHGGLSDLRYDNANLNTDGRRELWNILLSGIDDALWIGHGGNADRTWMLSHGAATYLPHNDWLRVAFNYGIVGLLIYALTMAGQILVLRPLIRSPDPDLRALAAAAASCFVAYAFIMCTDNVMIYCQEFTVPMMILVGASYSIGTRRQRTRSIDPAKLSDRRLVPANRFA